jgi:hypothetical protein
MKQFKTKISEKPFKLYGYTLEEFLRWCDKNGIKPYVTDSKRVFFKRINEHLIVKINGKVFDEGVEV